MAEDDPLVGWWKRKSRKNRWLLGMGTVFTVLFLVGTATGSVNEILDFLGRFRTKSADQALPTGIPTSTSSVAPAAAPATSTVPRRMQEPRPAERVEPLAECRYLWVEGYPDPRPREFRATARIDDLEVGLDDSDILRGRLFIFKGYLPGRAYRIDYSYWETHGSDGLPAKNPERRRYLGDMVFGSQQFYRLRWPKIPPTYPPSAGVLKPVPVLESELASLLAGRSREIPDCAGVQRGISILE